MAVNDSKKKDPRMKQKWRHKGALGRVLSAAEKDMFREKAKRMLNKVRDPGTFNVIESASLVIRYTRYAEVSLESLGTSMFELQQIIISKHVSNAEYALKKARELKDVIGGIVWGKRVHMHLKLAGLLPCDIGTSNKELRKLAKQ